MPCYFCLRFVRGERLPWMKGIVRAQRPIRLPVVLSLQDVIARHPRLRRYVENAGFPFIDETIALLYRHPRVYVDLSAVTWLIPRPMFHRTLNTLVDAGLSSRMTFGSDQMNWPDTIDDAIDAIQTAPMLTARQKRDIFYNNAARSLRLGKTP